ncbi:MAG: PIN domain-containing protein [Syntrophothermus sp.]|uniref:PIN domain-containing protein n=1 Tax=Syntrophothermus sp. TaxID=2736299 RepID=UPI002580AB74|nr:PIN domain-containing protein [Syntrophothermus sp.]NSW81657.1 PIN domain-containing protein [Syntrophothermus sp.]
MRLLIDTNVVLDVLMHRKEFFDASYEVLKLSALNKAEILITANTITDIYYIFQRSNKDHAKSKEAIVKLLKLVSIADVLASDVMNALSSKITDFEDALVGAIAKRVKADYIVTRNTKDFHNSPVPAIDPQNFLVQVNRGNGSCG